MTARDLKNALLQEAVQGKLVPQIASEGNARDLLEEIRKEKLSHGLDFANAKSGKRKSKKETALTGSNPCDITEDEIPFDIPESWCWCRLGEIVSILGDGIHGTPNYDISGNYYFVNGNNLNNGKIEIKPDTKKINQSEYEKYKKELNNNTVFVSINGTLGNIAFYENEKIILGKSACYFNLIKNEMKIYIYWLIKTKYFLDYANEEATGTTIKNVSLAAMRNFPIPLPPLAEQKRIVAAIEKFMPLIEEYGKKETQLKAINEKIGTLTKKAILQEAVQGKLVPQIAAEGNAKDLLEEIRKEKLSHGLDFANAKSGKRKSKKETALTGSNPCDITEDEIPFDIPESWCWCRLGEIVSILGDGIHGTPNYDISGNYYFVNGNNLNNGKIEIKPDTKKINQSEYEKYKKELNNNTVFVSINGTLGNIAFYENEKIILGKSACYFNLIKNEMKIYIYWLIKTKYFLDYANEEATGTTIKNVSLAAMRNFPIPLPPLAEQKRIVAAIEKFMPLIEEYGKKETQLKAINEKIGTLTKKAILQEAVQGNLVPQIAAEGNAKDLLEEIKREKAKLIKEGKIKKEKPLPEITEDEIPFDIPESWCWCRLSELCNLYTGDSINETEKKLKYTNIKEGWFYIGTKDVNFDQTINYDNGIKIPFEKDNFRIAPKNTVLMCIEGGSAGRKIAFTNQDVCFGNKLCCFNSYKNEIEKFIFYFLQSTLFTDAFKDNINGIIGGVSINNLKGMLFPLPPLAEQKRIVDVIEKMLPLCEKLGE